MAGSLLPVHNAMPVLCPSLMLVGECQSVHALVAVPVRCGEGYGGNVLFAGGLVQAASFSVLPDVGAGAAASAVFVSMAPLLVAIWKQPSPAHFASCTALASLNRCPLFTGNVCMLLLIKPSMTD